MNESSDTVLLASARRALADAAPAEPSPDILAAVRRAAARRARSLRLRRALLLAAAVAAAAVAAFVLPSSGPRGETPPAGGPIALADGGAQPGVADTPAAAALRLLVLDAAETRAALAVASTESAADEEADSGADVLADATAAAAADWSSLSFSEALLAWQEAPLADFADSAVF